MDAPWLDAWPHHTDSPPARDNMPWEDSNPYRGMGRFCKNRHEGYINCLFLDFSVKKIGLKQMWTLKWHRTFNTCGRWTKCGGATTAAWNAAAPWMSKFPEY
jgi:prepilin-type processing-associated H-X9-DG protein